MSGYLYPYTPYPTAGNLQSAGQAFLGGFSTGQEIEGRAQEMDARNQLQKLRQAQEERERQTFPLRMQLAEQQMKFAAQNQPVTLEGLRLRNQALQASLNAAAQQRAAAAEYARFIANGSSFTAPGTPAVPSAPITQSPGLAAPATPAPAPVAPQYSPYGGDTVTPGPQSNLDFGVQRFGDRDFNRRFSGMQLASAGINDGTGLPTGMTPEMLEPDYQQYPQTGFPTGQGGPSPTAPGALPAAMLPPEQRAGAVAPAPAAPQLPMSTLPADINRELAEQAGNYELDRNLARITAGQDQESARSRLIQNAMQDVRALINAGYEPQQAIQETLSNTDYGGRINAADLNLFVPPGQPIATPPVAGTRGTRGTAASAPGTQFSPFGETAPGLAGAIPASPDFTVAPTGGPAGLRPQGAETPEQISARLQRQLTSGSDLTLPGLSVFDPFTAGVESRLLDNTSARLDLQERQLADMRRQAAILARSGPAGMTQAMQMMQAVREREVELLQQRQNLGVSRANLNGRANISEFNNGNFAPLADDIFRSSNGSLRLQPTQDGKFNVLDRNNNVIATRTRDDILTVGRRLYDENYKKAIEDNRTRIASRREALFKTTLDAFEQSLKDQSQAGREISVERAKADFNRQSRNTELEMRVTTNGEIVVVHKYDPTKPIRAYKVQPGVDPRTGRPTGRNELVPVSVAPEAVFTQ